MALSWNFPKRSRAIPVVPEVPLDAPHKVQPRSAPQHLLLHLHLPTLDYILPSQPNRRSSSAGHHYFLDRLITSTKEVDHFHLHPPYLTMASTSWTDLLNELNKDVAKEQPQDVVQFGADWFQARLKREVRSKATKLM